MEMQSIIDEIQKLESPDRSIKTFEEMKSGTHRRAYSMALQLTRNPSDAEDLVQETYIKAWKGFSGYHSDRPFLNWLLRIMQRAYLDSRRRDNPIRKADSLNSLISPSDGEVQEISIPDHNPSVEEEMIYREFSAELRNALSELPEVYRASLELCDLQELSYSEIAEMQGTTVGTVRSRIHRGRKLLRDIVISKGIRLPER